jgi:CheY-like chemotaxis protein
VRKSATLRTELELLQDQLDGLQAWHRARRDRLAAEQLAAGATREMRLDANRRIEALQRAHSAVLGRADRAAREQLGPLPPRALLVHRSEWLRNKLTVGLAGEGITVLDGLDDGADGLGTAIVEQPDLLVVDERLPSVPGVELVRQARVFVPRAVIAAQVEDDKAVPAVLDAGADAVFHRRVPPAVLAERVADYLRKGSDSPLLLT